MAFEPLKDFNSFLSNTYMEKFCKSVHPDIKLETVCVNWFQRATKHCADLIIDTKEPTSYLWTTVRKFLFPDRTTAIAAHKPFISVYPSHLSARDCQSLLSDIIADYVQKAPLYATVSKKNSIAWQLLYSLLVFVTFVAITVAVVYARKKRVTPQELVNHIDQVFKPEKCMWASAKRSLRLAKAEVRNIHVKPVAKTEDIIPSNGANVLALKITKKLEFYDSLVEGNLQTVGKLHRLYNQYTKTKADFKIEAVTKAMKFVDNNCKKLHLVLMFEDDVEYEEPLVVKRKSNIPMGRSLSPSLLPSPRNLCSSPRLPINTKLDGSEITLGSGICSSFSGASSPKSSKTFKSTNSQRVGGGSNSTLSRNASKSSANAKKIK